MSWENSTRNIFFARALNSYGEAELDALEAQPIVRIIDRLHQIGVLNQNVRYARAKTEEIAEVPAAPKWLGTLFVEPLCPQFKRGGMAYRDVLRMIVWQPDTLTPYWLLHDTRIDLTRAEIAFCPSSIDAEGRGVGDLSGPTGKLKTNGSAYAITAGGQYEEDLCTVWDANLCETSQAANMKKFYDLTEMFVDTKVLPVNCPVVHERYPS